MNKVYKTAIFITSFLLILFVGQIIFAQGKGYFLEKNGNLYILDNLHINGYLAVENTLSSASGLPGDVLVGQNLLLDENKKFYFCRDDRAAQANAPRNLDCANKSLAWNPEGLAVTSNSYQLTTGSLSAVNSINFNAEDEDKKITTESSVRLTNEGSNCFSNNGSDDCNTNELKTGSMIIAESLAPLKERNLNFTAQTLIFEEINLGPDANMDNQYICWQAGSGDSCTTAKSGDRISGGTKWDFVAGGVTYSGTIKYSGDEPKKLCCHLNINF